MNDNHDLERLERLLRQTAEDLRGEYPPTPPIAASVRRQLDARRRPATVFRARLIRAVAIAAAAFVALLLVSPDARQAVARFFGLETVRIERIATVPAPTPTAAGRPGESLFAQLAGLTTLSEARAKASFEIRLPAIPGLGEPDRVYFQQFGFGHQVILVYPEFVIFESQAVIYGKGVGEGTVIEETRVEGQYALWLSGSAHILLVQRPDGALREADGRIVEGNVLAWEVGDVTYRIETNLPLEEALRVAESLNTTDRLVGVTTLAEARSEARFDVRLPSYPPGLGDPARVYFQDFAPNLSSAQQVILVYAEFTLYESENVIYEKSIRDATVVEEVSVDGRPALWLTGGEHLVLMRDRSGTAGLDFRRVEGSVLAWESGDVTYRIETNLPLAEARRIAESIE